MTSKNFHLAFTKTIIAILFHYMKHELFPIFSVHFYHKRVDKHHYHDLDVGKAITLKCQSI